MSSWKDFNDAAQIAATKPAYETETLRPAQHMESVALELLGEPNRALSTKREWRYGTRGSLAVDVEAGTWFDHEQAKGGGVLDLIIREHGGNRHEASRWLEAREGVPAPSWAPPARAKPKMLKTYPYHDEAGKHLFDVVRFEPKDFRQRAADGTWKVKGIRKVLYRLPQIAAAPDGTTIYIVEGEKDVHRLEAEGLLAATNPGGAGKWSDDYAASLKGKKAVIVPDNDQAGRDHAEAVQASLARHGIPCGVLNLEGLAEKGDVADWLDKGNTAAELENLAREAVQTALPPKPDKAKFSLIRADQLEFREPDWTIKGMMEAETLALLFADPGSGKSFVALDMCASVATGCGFHGREAKQGAVIYICGEGKNGIKRRLAAWEKHHGVSLANAPLFVSSMAGRFLSPESVKEMVQAIDAAAQEAGNVAMIVVDTLNRNMGAGDESSTADMSSFIGAVDMVKDRYEATAMIVHHTGHGNKDRARGSMALLGAVDAEYRIEKSDDLVIMTCTKMKEASVPPPVAFRMSEIEIGQTRLGEPITSAALSETEAEVRAGKRPLKGNAKVILEALQQFIADHGQPNPGGTGWPDAGAVKCVSEAEFTTFSQGKMGAEREVDKRVAVRKAVALLQERGFIQKNNNMLWIV